MNVVLKSNRKTVFACSNFGFENDSLGKNHTFKIKGTHRNKVLLPTIMMLKCMYS